ncbi:MAG: hypothetical protein WA840_05420 [Caulobacteraceae bacterium]
MVVRTSGAGWTQDVTIGRAERHREDPAETALSLAFLANARGFHASAVTAQDRFPRQAAHFLAIAIELSLKSYLLHLGFSDAWNRVHIGHDLGKALWCARGAGFHAVPSRLPPIATHLGPYYLGHAFEEMEPEALAALGSNAPEAVRTLHDAVSEAICQDEPFDVSIPAPSGLRS